MATDSSYPQVPSNYVTIHDLRERWMKKKRQQEELDKEQQPKHEPTLSQPHQRNHVRRGKQMSSAAAIAPPGYQTGLAMAATQAEESRVSAVEEQSALVAVEETGATRLSKSKRKKTKKKKKKFGIDGNGKARLDEDADGSAEHAPAGNVAGESVSSTDLLKDGTLEVEVKCVSTESKAIRQLQPKIKRHTHIRARKVAGESIATEKKVSKIDLVRVKIQNDGLDTESLPKIKNDDPANPTFKMEDKFKKLSMQDDRRGYRGGGRGRGSGRQSFYSGGEMVWIKKVEKAADDDHSGSSSKLLN